MKEKAESIAECPLIENLWHLQASGHNISVTSSEIQLSHSDIGPYIHIFCPEGQHVIGPTMITCLKNGVWDDITLPYCSSSAYFGIPSSDLILIGTLAGSAAIVIFTLTLLLAHLLCFRDKRSCGLSSRDQIGRSTESIPSTAASMQYKSHYTISGPSDPTRNGVPVLHGLNGHHNIQQDTEYRHSPEVMPYRCASLYRDNDDDIRMTSSQNADSVYHVADYPPPPPSPLPCHVPTRYDSRQSRGFTPHQADDDRRFMNHAYLDDHSGNYAARWNDAHALPALSSPSGDVHIQPLYRNPGTTFF